MRRTVCRVLEVQAGLLTCPLPHRRAPKPLASCLDESAAVSRSMAAFLAACRASSLSLCGVEGQMQKGQHRLLSTCTVPQHGSSKQALMGPQAVHAVDHPSCMPIRARRPTGCGRPMAKRRGLVASAANQPTLPRPKRRASQPRDFSLPSSTVLPALMEAFLAPCFRSVPASAAASRTSAAAGRWERHKEQQKHVSIGIIECGAMFQSMQKPDQLGGLS